MDFQGFVYYFVGKFLCDFGVLQINGLRIN
jgi:hypothetical protein